MFNVFWGLIVVYICCTFIRQTELNPAMLPRMWQDLE